MRAVVSILTISIVGCAASPVYEVEDASKDDRMAFAQLAQDLPPLRNTSAAELAVQVDGGRMGRMLLAETYSDGTQYWLASDGKGLWIRSGRIVMTEGLGNDLNRVVRLYGNRADEMFDLLSGQLDRIAGLTSYILAEPGHRFVVQSKLFRSGERLPLRWGKRTLTVQKIRERVSSELDESYWFNEYWLEVTTGVVVSSSQKLPGSGHVVRFRLRRQQKLGD